MPERPRKDDPALRAPERAREGWTAVDPEALARQAERERRRAQSRRRMLLGVAIASIVVLVAAISGVSAFIVSALSQRSAAAAAAAAFTPVPLGVPFPDDKPATAAGAGPCIPVTVLSSFENAEMVADLAAGYNAQPRDVGGSCVTVTTTKERSGVAAQEAAAGFASLPADQKPTIWLPDAHTWLAIARAQGAEVLRTDGTSVGSSDIVLAMPKALADAVGWTQNRPSWKDVFDAARNPSLWNDLGHPEWGTFKLGKTSPTVATSGAAAMYASYSEAAGSFSNLTVAEVQDPAVAAAVTQGELATSHYMATPEHFLWHARQAEASGSVADFLSAVIVDEKSVWDYNRGITSRDGITREQSTPPKESLVPIYPTDGFYVADNPIVALAGSWIDAAKAAAAADFVHYTGTAQAQQIVRASGYRDLHGQLDDAVAATGLLSPDARGALPFPEYQVVAAVNTAFAQVRKRAQLLFLVDVSGSMNDPIGNGESKMAAAKNAISAALGYFTPGDEVGLAAFAADRQTTQTGPGMVSPVADIGTTRDQLTAALSRLEANPTGDTPLYEAVDTFAQQEAAGYAPDRINAIVLLSDGKNDMRRTSTSAEQMLADLEQLHHAGTPVLVFTLAYGADADVATLQSISSATGAHYYDATDPTRLTAVLQDLVTSF